MPNAAPVSAAFFNWLNASEPGEMTPLTACRSGSSDGNIKIIAARNAGMAEVAVAEVFVADRKNFTIFRLVPVNATSRCSVCVRLQKRATEQQSATLTTSCALAAPQRQLLPQIPPPEMRRQ
jgi:hypothetical protein